MSIEWIGRRSEQDPYDLTQEAMAAILSSYCLPIEGRPRVLMPSASSGVKSSLHRRGLAYKLIGTPGDRWALTETGLTERDRLLAIYELEYAL